MSISEHQAHYDMMNTGCWAVRDAKECPCHGHGYALSEVDTWHKCPIHHAKGQHHPEDECDCGQLVCVRQVPRCVGHTDCAEDRHMGIQCAAAGLAVAPPREEPDPEETFAAGDEIPF